MKLNDREHYELLGHFEQASGLSKNPPAREKDIVYQRQGAVYHSGELNRDFRNFRNGYSIGKRLAEDNAMELVDALQQELAAVLDVAIARGESLGYDSDDDYKARYRELTGKEWENE